MIFLSEDKYLSMSREYILFRYFETSSNCGIFFSLQFHDSTIYNMFALLDEI